MGVLLIIFVAATALILGGRFYAPLIARALGEKKDRQTPAVAINDGRDYIPTKTPVVFAHHFASIAGAGPIIGPVIALIYGWGPALLWIVLGGIFMGAVHDYVATHVALREGGKSITITARRTIGKGAFVMLLILLITILALVCAAFLDLSARALTSEVSLTELQMSADQNVFRVSGDKAIIGGIASTSVVVITAFSPLIGFFYLKRKWPVWVCSMLAIGICCISVAAGFKWPMSIDPQTWKLLICGYVLISAGLPVWLFLQSRDFINVHLLYIGMILMFISLIAAGFRGGGEFANGTGIPFNNWAQGSEVWGWGWPVMFITIACGAVSGFHSLCAGGTTCKQLSNEYGARRVGYYAMLLESFLSVIVVCSLLVGLSLLGYRAYCHPLTEGGTANPILTFAVAVGSTTHAGLGLEVWTGVVGAMLILEGFLVTTLDTAIRLMRYLFEEGWSTFFARYDVFAEQPTAQKKDSQALAGTGGMNPESIRTTAQPTGLRPIRTQGLQRKALGLLKHYWINSGLAVLLTLLLGYGNGYKVLWQIFGASNQLLAALALLICTMWLLKKQRPVFYTLIPAVFMLVTATTEMVRKLLTDFWPNRAEMWPLVLTDILILAMTAGIVTLAIQSWRKPHTATQPQTVGID